MVEMKEVSYITEKEFQLIRITKEVDEFVSNSTIQNGVVHVITEHTTSGILVNENLPCLFEDIEETLERLIPKNHPYAHAHFLPSYGATGGNAPGHLKSMLCGNHAVFVVENGKIKRRFAQDIFFAEFDGPQRRTLIFHVMGE